MTIFEFEGWHNRWLVAFSGAALAFMAVIAGTSRLYLERMEPEWRTNLMPDAPLSYAGLSVIALLFLVGMGGNMGLLLRPLNRRSGVVSLLTTGAMVGILLILTLAYGSHALRVVGGGLKVSGGE
jgi:hypothetical protein